LTARNSIAASFADDDVKALVAYVRGLKK